MNLKNHVKNNKGLFMKAYFSAVVQYVKNLLPCFMPAAVPSENPKLDADALATIASDTFYTVARNGCRYWYCYAPVPDMRVAQYLLMCNGVCPSKHKSRYFYNPTPAFRFRMSYLENNKQAKDFIDNVMQADDAKMDKAKVQARIAEVRQKVK